MRLLKPIRNLLSRLFSRLGDATQRAEVDRLTKRLAEAESTIQLQHLQIEGLTAVVARDRKRVEAETAIEARKIAAASVATSGGDLERLLGGRLFGKAE